MSSQQVQPSIPEISAMTAARRAVQDMVDGGVRHVVVSPGSRSAPLAYAIAEFEAQHPDLLTSHVRIDERSAAFFALGIGLNTGRPAAVVTTSGTAVGNLLPAVMEANHASVPLLLLTADRPEELLGTGANQTTVQDGIFGGHVRFAVTVPAGADPTGCLRQALTASLGILTHEHSQLLNESNPQFAPEGVTSHDVAPGPVHVNLSFRDPLTPGIEDDDAALRPEETLAESGGPVESGGLVENGGPVENRASGSGDGGAGSATVSDDTAESLRLLAGTLQLEERRTVVIAGHDAGPIAEHFAKHTGLPLLAEPSSNARYGENAVTAYRLLIPSFVESIDRAVVFGRPTLNREIAALLKSERVPSALYVPEPVAWFDAGKRTERMIEDLEDLLLFAGRGPADWLSTWHQAAEQAVRVLEPIWRSQPDALSAHDVARAVWNTVDGNLVIGSSNIIRDIDIAAPARSRPLRVFANRGLAGIDGTISTALGIAASADTDGATNQSTRTTLVVGDVTFLHDASALVRGALETSQQLDVVVLNDHGGGIFSTLEHGTVGQRPQWQDAVERFFGTPQDVDVSSIARGYGAEYRGVGSAGELESILREESDGVRVIETHVSRAERSAHTRAMREAVESVLENVHS